MNKRHEQLLFRYSSALERGDFEAVAEILREAEHEPELEAMILELNAVYAAEPLERFNHKQPKELSMIAPLYQNRTPARTRPYNLPMIAALAVVALIGVLLATRIAPPTQWNSGQDGSPEAIVMQIDPTECERGLPVTIKLYSRPSETSFITYEVNSILYFPQSALRQLDAAEADGETWYFVSVDQGVSNVQGWMTAAEYNRNVRCAALVNPTIIAQVTESAVMTGTPTPAPFEENFDVTVTAIAEQASAMPPTVVPPDVQALTTFTPTPIAFSGNEADVAPVVVEGLATIVPPVDVQAAQVEVVPTVVPALVGSADTLSFPVHIVQEGETMISILARYNLNSSVLDDLRRINQLPADAGIVPGQALMIPLNMPELITTCTIAPDEFLDVHIEADENSPILVTLPAGTELEVHEQIEQPDSAWVRITAQVRGMTVSGGWLRLDVMDFVTDCTTDVAAFATANASIASLSLPITDPMNYPDGLLNCYVETESIVKAFFPASMDASVSELPAGTKLQIIRPVFQADGTWYQVDYYLHVNPPGSLHTGFVSPGTITLPEGCQPAHPAPVPVLQNVTGAAVQCSVTSEEAVNIFNAMSPFANVITQLAPGSTLNVLAFASQPDGIWYYVSYSDESGSAAWGLVAPNRLTVPEGCLYNAESHLAAEAMVDITATALTPTPAR